jgi:hypothetical protein
VSFANLRKKKMMKKKGGGAIYVNSVRTL